MAAAENARLRNIASGISGLANALSTKRKATALATKPAAQSRRRHECQPQLGPWMKPRHSVPSVSTARISPPRSSDVAEHVGYPLYMKPFDGGQWVGVTRIKDEAELHAQYDASGQRLMHLQAS